MLLPKKISVYITKDIFKRFFFLFFGLFILIFVIEIFERSDDIIDYSFVFVLKYILYRIPNFLEIALPFILLIASLISFYKLSNDSEIIVMRTAGMSIFQIVKLPLISSFILGILVIFLYNPISSKLAQKGQSIKHIMNDNNKEEVIIFKNGLWLKQDNLEDSGDIIIKIGSAHKNLLVFNDAIIIYIDENNMFTKRIDVEKLQFVDGTWIATNGYIFQESKNSEFLEKFSFKAKLTKDFLQKTITNEYEYIYNIPFIELKDAITSLDESGFSATKFKVRYYSFLVLPFLFSAMILISAYFGIVHYRDAHRYVSLLYGIGYGSLIFILNQIIVEIANTGKLTIFDSNIFLVLIFILISLILLLKKDAMSNL
ncbi:MAG: LptF/LptG family permease [Rickettsiales bacterium]|jgi:lipopolysaccharide export system permease protein|nr:LptF/LptG family permease [Rickettsiales bacterium]